MNKFESSDSDGDATTYREESFLNRKKTGPTLKKKTIEERYQKKTPIEHILHRPESYIGSVQCDSQQVWVWNQDQHRMEFKTISFVPGLFKIFDEILVNAADVKAREDNEKHRTHQQQHMTTLKVTIDQTNGLISVYNDGDGIPIEIHKEHQIYVPELIFGHLLTSDNYDDSEERVTGGRNGYGAKLTNIFSKLFTIECADSQRKRKFQKTWKNNMEISESCKITDYKEHKDYVKVTFIPDLQRFQLDSLNSDFISLLTKRVYDVAGCCGIKVWLNGQRLQIDNFKSYTDLYFPSMTGGSLQDGCTKPPIKIHEKSDRWEVIISMSEGQFQQVSFVNSISTIKGGSHVNYVIDPLITTILKKVNSKNKGGMELKAHHVKAHIWIFVNCLIVNPTFDSQSKETLTLKSSQFGSKFVLSDKTINSVIKSDIVESILLWAKMKQQVELQKKMKGTTGRGARDRISGIPKLEDANDAGTKYSEHCTLILTEGESAKTSCVAGLSVVGRDRYGVFPLRGKLLNVREASFKQQIENQEIQAILKIMGLQVGKKFDSPKGLRYGSLMIMTDQDLDGSHIKGLLVNMIAHYWPQLLQYRGFLKEFVTPIVKVTKQQQTLPFFTLTEYEEWRQQNNGGKGWKIRYYKGLGTSTDKEFKEYFSQLEEHSLDFVYETEDDLNCIDMAFNSKRAEDRKQWIQGYQEGHYVDHSQSSLTYSDFINKELVLFSKYDVFRSIPNGIDGLKPVQRKVLFAAFKKNLKTEMKVAQLTGYISEKTAYHHGEQSLGTTIIAMAQNFIGSNNLNLLQPCGQFGSRKEGGKDASAVRYIFTRLTHLARAIFPEADDPLLEYQNDDGLMVEPKYYIPVIPLVLVNGVEGIGTGWSSSVPNYNPQDLIMNIRRFIRGESMEPMTPWYKGYTGRIEKKVGGFESVGTIKKLDDETLQITELPVKVWTQNYKQFLEELLHDPILNTTERDESQHPRGRGRHTASINSFTIVDYRDNSTHESIDFTIKLTPANMARVEQEGLEKAFKLRKSIGTTNMTLFDHTTKVQRYATELDIIRECGQLRLQYYELRREYLIEKLERDCKILKNKQRFIQDMISGSLNIHNRKQEHIIADLIERRYETLTEIYRASKLIWKLEQERSRIESEFNKDDQEVTDDPTTITTDTPSGISLLAHHHAVKQETKQSIPTQSIRPQDFEYLLGMSLWNLSEEKIVELKNQATRKLYDLDVLKQTTPEQMWEDDLILLEKALEEQDTLDKHQRQEDLRFKTARRHSFTDKTRKKVNRQKGTVTTNTNQISHIEHKQPITKKSQLKLSHNTSSSSLSSDSDESFSEPTRRPIASKQQKLQRLSTNTQHKKLNGIRGTRVQKTIQKDLPSNEHTDVWTVLKQAEEDSGLYTDVLNSSSIKPNDIDRVGITHNMISQPKLSLIERIKSRHGKQGGNTETLGEPHHRMPDIETESNYNTTSKHLNSTVSKASTSSTLEDLFGITTKSTVMTSSFPNKKRLEKKHSPESVSSETSPLKKVKATELHTQQHGHLINSSIITKQSDNVAHKIHKKSKRHLTTRIIEEDDSSSDDNYILPTESTESDYSHDESIQIKTQRATRQKKTLPPIKSNNTKPRRRLVRAYNAIDDDSESKQGLDSE